MQFGMDPEGHKVPISKAAADITYKCIYCGAPLILKRGDIRIHHYAHVQGSACSDEWSSSYELSTWHIEWQNRFPESNQEIKLTLGNISHRADVMVGRTVVEFQHSRISPKHFSERNNYYVNFGNKIIWLFDCREEYKKGKIVVGQSSLKCQFINYHSAFRLTDIYRPDIELFFQLKDEGNCIVRAKTVHFSYDRSFTSDKWYSMDDFVIFTCSGLKPIPAPEYLTEKTEEYKRFLSKHDICLTQQQERAVQTVYGPVLILAVPGSGKTTVLVDRIGYMCEVKGVDPYQVLAITFTRSAAKEMQKRVSQKYGKMIGNAVSFKTINSLSMEIIRCYCNKYSKKIPRIIDEKIKKKIVRETLKSLGKQYVYEKDVIEVLTAVSYAKNRMITHEEKRKYLVGDLSVQEIIDKITEKMQRYSKEGEWIIDYDDQLVYANNILQRCPDILQSYQDRYRFVSLDEAQDTTKIQFEIINKIASASNNLFIVGDDDQSIYGFRGAFPEEIYAFRDNYVNPSILYLEDNFRSYVEITSVADSFIANSRRFAKTIHSDRGVGGSFVIQKVDSREEQFDSVLNNALKEKKTTGVLYRDNISAIQLVCRLTDLGIPYKLLGGDSFFFESKRINEFLAFLRIVNNPQDIAVFKENIRTIFGDIDEPKWNTWIPKAVEEGKTISEALREQYEHYQFSSNKKNKSKYREAELWATLIEECPKVPMEAIKFYDYHRPEELDPVTIDNLLFFAKKVVTIDDFISAFNKASQLLSKREYGDSKITLSTIHSSKGLEFDNVMIIDVIEGIFPSKSAIESDTLKEEEKRLMYVAMTRAKNSLTVYSIKEMSSSFIAELDWRQPLIDLDVNIRRLIYETTEKGITGINEADVSQSKKKTVKRESQTGSSYKNEMKSSNFEIENDNKIGTDEIIKLVDNEETPAIDSHGVRWVRCSQCNEIKRGYEFTFYGGVGSINRGICRECHNKKCKRRK